MNWRCPKQVPHYPPGFSFYLENLTIFANLFVPCEKFCNIFQKNYQKWSSFTLSKLIFQNFPIFGSKNNKICENKKSQLSIRIYPKVLWSPCLSTLAWSELTIIRDNGGSNLRVKAPWWGHSQIRALWWDDSRV